MLQYLVALTDLLLSLSSKGGVSWYSDNNLMLIMRAHPFSKY